MIIIITTLDDKQTKSIFGIYIYIWVKILSSVVTVYLWDKTKLLIVKREKKKSEILEKL